MTRDYRAGAPIPPRDLEAFQRAKAHVDHALELRRAARDAEEPLEENGGQGPVEEVNDGG